MRIGLLHGYELRGSGSNEYVRYLSRALARLGHEVHVLCREPHPEAVPHVGEAYRWERDGSSRRLFRREPGEAEEAGGAEGTCVVHQLPHGDVRPVYLKDKQREGRVRSFPELSDAELNAYHETYRDVVRAVLKAHPVDLVQANHLVWQPSVAAEAGVPFAIYPHGSSIEYTVRRDERYRRHARTALEAATGLITGNREVRDRILALFPEDRDRILEKSVIVGVGVDTSLFGPIDPEGRRAALAHLKDGGGKRPEQRAELRARLDRGDYGALAAYHGAYDHGEPDSDLTATLARVPFEEGRVCLFVGALTAGKGLQGVIAAFPRVLPAHLLIVGSGAYREVLEALVHAIATGNRPLFDHLARNGFDLDRSDVKGPWRDVTEMPPKCPALAEHVHFLGRLDHDRLRYVFPCADLAVFPSVIPEAYPLVLMESLSAGVLPAVSDFSGFRDGLDELDPLLGARLVSRMRLPVDPETRVDAMAERLNALLADDTLLGRKADLHRIAVEHFDWDVRARQMVKVYETLLSRNA